MGLFWSKRKGKQLDEPPAWAPAAEERYTTGLYNEATDDEYKSAEEFCSQHSVQPPRLLPSHIVDRISAEGCNAWTINVPTSDRFVGRVDSDLGKGGARVVKVVTDNECKSFCLTSELPIMAGLYDIQGKKGVYFEVQINKMEGIIAIGTTCCPYPEWRFPGWNRLSAGLHLDDFRKFFEDPDGGRDYDKSLRRISPGDTVGCGYEFATTGLFFTYNGQRLSAAFSGIYLPRGEFDVYAAIGVEGANEIKVNFGGDVFRWKEGNDWAWRVEGQVGSFIGSSTVAEELPKYEEVV